MKLPQQPRRMSRKKYAILLGTDEGNGHPQPASDTGQSPGQSTGPSEGTETVMVACLRRILHWRVPRNWSRSDWHEEIRAVAAAAALEAANRFDPSRGVSRENFVRSRVLGRALARYRQEWSFAYHCACDGVEKLEGSLSGDTTVFRKLQVLPPADASDDLLDVLHQLSAQDAWLLQQLFWLGQTEAQVGLRLGISQRAVSKRKHAALGRLRSRLNYSQSFGSENGRPVQLEINARADSRHAIDLSDAGRTEGFLGPAIRCSLKGRARERNGREARSAGNDANQDHD